VGERQSAGGGWVSTQDSLGVAFEMNFVARQGDVLKVSVNEDVGEPIRGEMVLSKKTPPHVMVVAQKNRIEFSTMANAPVFR